MGKKFRLFKNHNAAVIPPEAGGGVVVMESGAVVDTDDTGYVAEGTLEERGNPHYKHRRFETWDVIADWRLGYFDGNAVKYLSRWRIRGQALKDLRKARHYIDKLIELLESGIIPEPNQDEDES